MTVLTRRDYRLDPFDWVEHVMRPGGFLGSTMYGMRVEDELREDMYVLRAELPGMDPDKDIDIQVTDGVLTIHAERKETTATARRSEFRYGEFTRSITLPSGASADNVSARYTAGILEVTVPIVKPAEARSVPIAHE